MQVILRIITFCLWAASSLTAQLSQHKALDMSKQAISQFFQKASATDKKNFEKYLSYYRSVYQSVTPAPRKLCEALSQQAKQLFEQIKVYVGQAPALWDVEKRARFGASKLSAKGEQFYQDLIQYTQSL
jgi:hypothetical protein